LHNKKHNDIIILRKADMKRNIIFIVAIFLVVIAIITYSFYNIKRAEKESSQNNRAYQSFYNQEVLGTDVISIINKAIDSNEKNAVDKDEKGHYIDNNKNSIIIEIKFKEQEQIIKMEAIEKSGEQKFLILFGATSFKCTKIEYHQNTNNVKYMYFEQI
jgi:type II secretory pathway component PulL